jgi:hypothetical protein
MGDIRIYKMKGRYKGTDDMPSIYAFHGNSQGDNSKSNSVNDYISSDGWMSVSSYFKDIDYMNQEAVDKRSKELKLKNDKYVQDCKDNGTYGEYTGDIEISMLYNPLFDNNYVDKCKTESYKMCILDFSKK